MLIALSGRRSEALAAPLLPGWNVDGGLCFVQIGTSVVNSWAQQPCHAQSMSDSMLAVTLFLPPLPDSSLSLGDKIWTSPLGLKTSSLILSILSP